VKYKNAAILGGVALGVWLLSSSPSAPPPVEVPAPKDDKKDAPAAPTVAPRPYPGFGYNYGYGYQQPYQYGYGYQSTQYGYQQPTSLFASLLSPLINLFQPQQQYSQYDPNFYANVSACQNSGGVPVTSKTNPPKFTGCRYPRVPAGGGYSGAYGAPPAVSVPTDPTQIAQPAYTGRVPTVAPFYPKTMGYGALPTGGGTGF
jgi:hypothetical protein